MLYLLLGAPGIAPEAGQPGDLLLSLYLFQLVVNVKDASSTLPGASEDLSSAHL